MISRSKIMPRTKPKKFLLKKKQITDDSKGYFFSIVNRAKNLITDHPVIFSILVSFSYLLILQNRFLFSGDVWAETHMEYLHEAVIGRASQILEPGWAGYITILPSFLTKLYVYLRLPLGYIDYYFQVIIVFFAVGCAAFIAGNFMSQMFKDLYFRILIGLCLLLLLTDKGIFTFINIWYIGFLPLIFICLNHAKLSYIKQFLYTVFGILVVLTKPSVFMLPFFAYRAWKTKEYVSNSLLTVATLAQTMVMLFLDSRETSGQISKNLFLISKSIFIGGPIELFKLFGIIPTHITYIFVGNIIIAACVYLFIKSFGLLRTVLLAFVYSFSVYAFILAPDANLSVLLHDYQQLYNYAFKSQREYLIQALLIIFLLSAFYYAYKNYRSHLNNGVSRFSLVIIVSIVFMVRIFTPIDVESAGVAANIGPFRSALNSGQSACVPIPPTPYFFPHANWQYEFNSACHPRNFELSPDFENMNIDLKVAKLFTIKSDIGLPLKTLYFAIKNENPSHSARFTITNNETGHTYEGVIPEREREKINYIAVNVTGIPYRDIYHFTLTSEYPVQWGRFKETGEPIVYPYFGENRHLYYRNRM